MKLKISVHTGLKTVEISGAIEAKDILRLKKELESEAGPTLVVFDLSEVESLGSHFINLVAGWKKRHPLEAARLRLVNPNGQVVRIFRMAEAEDVLSEGSYHGSDASNFRWH